VSELDDLVRQRRFDEIHEARRQVIEDERSINEALATGRVDDGRARRLFQRAVDAYVRELEYLLNPPDSDEKNEYWHSTEIGRIPLQKDTERVVEGLGEYLDLPEEIAFQVGDVDRDHYYELGKSKSRTVAVQPGWRLLRSAFRTANAAATDLGMEIQISQEDRTEITDDLIDEVEQWRKENLQTA
jgi:hypothetical protein